MYSRQQSTIKSHIDVSEWNMKNMILTLFALITGGRIQTLPSGQVRIIFKWQYLVISLFAACFGTFIIMNTTNSLSLWNNIDLNDDEYIFAPFTLKKVSSRWRNYITNQPTKLPTNHPKCKLFFFFVTYERLILIFYCSILPKELPSLSTATHKIMRKTRPIIYICRQ
jgi:hypothetical protein